MQELSATSVYVTRMVEVSIRTTNRQLHGIGKRRNKEMHLLSTTSVYVTRMVEE